MWHQATLPYVDRGGIHVRFCHVAGVRVLLFTCIKATIATEEDVLITDFMRHTP
jgi:hypothetical protein